MTQKTAIVILNWNGKEFLQKFLPNVIANSENCNVIVADNASSDDSLAYLSSSHPTVEVIINDQNYGFAEGYNQALKQLKERFDYYILLNSDIEVTPGWSKPLIETLSSNSNYFAVQPKILAYHDKNKFEHAGASGGFIDRNYYPFCRGRVFDTVETDTHQYESKRSVFWASGACMAVDAVKFHELTGFDGDFFAHMEEIDLCWRAQRQGYEILIDPNAKVYHVGGGTLNYQSPRKTFLNFRNNLYMIHKNHEGFLVGKILYRLMLDGIAGVKFLVGLQFNHFAAILKAHFAYYGSIATLQRKRKNLKKSSKNNTLKGVYRGSILYAHFVKGIKKFSQLNQRRFE